MSHSATSNAQIAGKTREQFSYVWFYPAGGGDALRGQGVRMTLGDDGRALVWEVLADPQPVDIVYASVQLEQAALATFGPPARQGYAIESGSEPPSSIVVPRILEDGPAPMGPWVYLRAGDHAVTTLLCRCMPSPTTSSEAWM